MTDTLDSPTPRMTSIDVMEKHIHRQRGQNRQRYRDGYERGMHEAGDEITRLRNALTIIANHAMIAGRKLTTHEGSIRVYARRQLREIAGLAEAAIRSQPKKEKL